MKIIARLKIFVLAGLFLFAANSCSDGLTDINVDPNSPTAIPAVNLVTQAQYSLNNTLWSRGFNAEWTMLMVQHWAQNEYGEESRYTVDGNDFNAQWTAMYTGVLNELKTAREIIEADEGLNAKLKGNQLGIIKALEALTYQNITDAYGDAPFTQALNSLDFPLPSYDSQQSIYMAILAMFDEAATGMDASAPAFGSGDLIYGGDAAMWQKAIYSLMMRAAMRIVDVDAATAGTYIQKAAGKMLTSNDDNALFAFSDNPSLANPLFIDATINGRDDFNVTDVLVDNLKRMGDPRLEMYAKPNNVGEIVGIPYGLPDADAFELKSLTSRPSDAVRANTAPAVIIDYAEVMFMATEAFQRGILSGDAAAAYAEGIKASMNYWGITDDAAIDAYIAANPYDAANWKEALGWQKWIAFYMNGPQAWAEWRRLDFPQLAVPAAATNSAIPVRLPYPISEQTRNATSLGTVTSTPNDMNTKLWWDVN
ncbi:MAG: SusD/RagB family nutrient-binding outer membrane lipoprotein [Bacteroidota bacterium]